MEVCATQQQEEAEVKAERRMSHVRGDLFDVGTDWALCHCVSRDLQMSAGIAVTFMEKFGGL